MSFYTSLRHFIFLEEFLTILKFFLNDIFNFYTKKKKRLTHRNLFKYILTHPDGADIQKRRRRRKKERKIKGEIEERGGEREKERKEKRKTQVISIDRISILWRSLWKEEEFLERKDGSGKIKLEGKEGENYITKQRSNTILHNNRTDQRALIDLLY